MVCDLSQPKDTIFLNQASFRPSGLYRDYPSHPKAGGIDEGPIKSIDIKIDDKANITTIYAGGQ